MNIYLSRKFLKRYQYILKKQQSHLWQQQKIIIQIRALRLNQIFEKFKSALSSRVKEREVNHAITDCYNQKLLMNGFVKLKKAAKIMKKRNSNSIILINKRKQLYFDKWILRSQDMKLHSQLLADSSLYYKEFLSKKVFRGWRQFIKNQKKYYTDLECQKKIFHRWRRHTIQANEKRMSKCQPIHNKWRKLIHFCHWKAATLDSQKEKLAIDFFKFKLFQGWKAYVEDVKQIELKLQDKELQLTLQHMNYEKYRYLYQWINKYEQRIQKAGLIQVLLSTKLKQNKLKLLKSGYQSLKNNLKVNKFVRFNKFKLSQIVFFQFQYFSELTKAKMNQLIQYEQIKRKKKEKQIFDTLLGSYRVYKAKSQRSQEFYEKRLLKDCFYLFLTSILSEYERKMKLSEQFYCKRRIIYIFSALRKYTNDQSKRRINDVILKKYQGQKEYKYIKLVFNKFKGISISQSRGKKKYLQI